MLIEVQTPIWKLRYAEGDGASHRLPPVKPWVENVEYANLLVHELKNGATLVIDETQVAGLTSWRGVCVGILPDKNYDQIRYVRVRWRGGASIWYRAPSLYLPASVDYAAWHAFTNVPESDELSAESYDNLNGIELANGTSEACRVFIAPIAETDP